MKAIDKGSLAGAATIALAAMVAAPAPAQAQAGQAALPEQRDDTTVGTEIIVTAQKREERLQDVPLSVSVVGGSLVEQQGGINLENAQYLVPTLNFRKSGTSINQSLFLRGVGTSTFSIAGEPSVSTVVDGVVFSRAGEAFSDLVDIERIEVLRGPQGTLFGKNASAGVISIVSRRPGDTLGGYVDAGYFFGEGNEYRVRAALDLPLGAGAGLRLTGFVSDYDGNLFNEAPGVSRRVNGYDRWGVRGLAVIEPTPDLSITVIADYRRAKDDCCAEAIGTVPANLAAQVLPAPQGDATRRVRQNLVTATNEESYGASVQIDATLGTNTVTSITSWRRYDNEEIRDGDWLPRPFANAGLNELHDVGPQTGKTFTQELRLTSPQGGLLEYVGGLFYSWADTERTFTRDVVLCTPAQPVLTACDAPGIVVTRPSGTATFGSTFKNLAAFARVTLNITDQFRLLGGLRFTHDQLDVFHIRRTALAGPGIQPNFDQGVFDRYQQLVAAGVAPNIAQGQAVAASNGVPFTAKTTNDNWSGMAGAQFDLTPDNVLYATWTRGYKGPAFNIFFNLASTGTNVIEPETVDSYEAGIKNSFLDGRLVLNLSGYYARYDNFQANNPDVVAGVVVTRFTNAGRISTRGAELDLIFAPTRDLSLSGGIAYTDARVDQFRQPAGNVTGVIPPGTRLAYAPEWKASLAGDWRLRTGGAVDFGVNAIASWQSEQISQFDANPAVRAATTIDGYALVDLSLAVIDARDRFRLAFQVRNLFDQSFAAAITSGGPGGSYRYIIPREADRYFGVTGRVSF
ncbi:TonB-dependent receptor [Erythrobacteraceae bacterium CFH 75059]|uniref:TonB-dependent receptor n=1 Tax=Qipengyuania thermophila TaxID=2509361 RepID=UPI001021950F|nr:TonB-dependent receptor [Qipengyuania thermophila]TCD06659.1 TonB-dependent receptor [Erythrobacteraceae bacterium CFH 75059]